MTSPNEKNNIKWTHNGNFNEYHNEKGSTLTHKKKYSSYSTENKMKYIKLVEYNDGHRRIIIGFRENDMCKMFTEQCTGFDFDFDVTKYSDESIFYFKQGHIKKSVYDFLTVLIKFDDSIKNISSDICETFEISSSLGLDINQLSKMSISDACCKAIEVQNFDNYLLIFELATFYFNELQKEHSIVTLQELYDLLNLVKPENKYHDQLQDMKVNVLLLQDRNQMSLEEKHKTTQQLFMDSLNGTNQSLTDNLFSELCGNSLGEIFLDNVKCDIDTILILSDKIKELQNTINVLKI
jgi:hypothetical protein